MNKTIYASDPVLWQTFEELAHRRQVSVSRELERLMRMDIQAAGIEEQIRASVSDDPPNLIREVSRLERELISIRYALKTGTRREDDRR